MYKMVCDGQITDAMTVAAALRVKLLLLEGKLQCCMTMSELNYIGIRKEEAEKLTNQLIVKKAAKLVKQKEKKKLKLNK